MFATVSCAGSSPKFWMVNGTVRGLPTIPGIVSSALTFRMGVGGSTVIEAGTLMLELESLAVTWKLYVPGTAFEAASITREPPMNEFATRIASGGSKAQLSPAARPEHDKFKVVS